MGATQKIPAFSTAARAALSAALAACGGEVPRPSDRPAPAEHALPDEPAAAPALSDRPPPPDGPWSGVPWAESGPPGVAPLTDDERAALGGACKPFVDAVAGKKPRGSAASADPARLGIAEAILDVLADPPKVAGVDVPKCAGLLRRDTQLYLARAREERAVVAIKTVLARLAEAKGGACPAAAPVPSSFDRVDKGAPYESKKSDWSGPGWSCIGYDPLGAPQRFQLEVAATPGGFRVVARLRSVDAAPITELYVEGSPPADPSATVMRRAE